MLYSLYRPILDQTFAPPTYLPRPDGVGAVPLISTDLASAELIKYAANAFLALKICYINEIGQLAEKVGADIHAGGQGNRPGRAHRHALPAGGDRLGRLVLRQGHRGAGGDGAGIQPVGMPIVEAAREINRRQRERVVEKLLAELKILKGRTIGLLGLAFKPNTDDLREAPAIDIARKLVERGCKVKAHDPVALDRFEREHPDLPVVCCESPEEVADDADALVLVTEWQEYRELDWEVMASRMRSPLLLDGRQCTGQGALRAHRIPLSGNRELASRDYFTAMVTPAWLLAVPTVITTGTFPLFRPVGTVAFTCNRPAGSSGAAPA